MSLQSEYYESLTHHGVKGMKWGVRRFENEDGTLTPAGKTRYADYDQSLSRKKKKKIDKLRAKEREALEAATKAGDKSERADQKGNSKKASKYEQEASKYDATADKYNKKIRKIIARSEKWAQTKTRVVDLSKATVSRGKEAAGKAIDTTKVQLGKQKQKVNSAMDRYIANSPNNRNRD